MLYVRSMLQQVVRFQVRNRILNDMDQMEDILIDADYNDTTFTTDTITFNNTGNGRRDDFRQTNFVHSVRKSKRVVDDRSDPDDFETSEGHSRVDHHRDSALANVIMMYSPDIPSAEGDAKYDSRTSLATYYSTIELEEGVKCVVSSVLFVAIIVAIFLVALLKNPEM